MDKRTALAVLLCGLLTLAYFYFVPRTAPAPAEAPGQETPTPPPGSATGAPPPAASPAVTPVAAPAATPVAPPKAPAAPVEKPPAAAAPTSPVALPSAPPETTTEVEADEYHLTFTNRGGSLLEAEFKDYYKTYKHEANLRILAPAQSEEGAASLAVFDPEHKEPYDSRCYDLVEQTKDHLVYRALFDNGLEITKEYTFPPERFHIELAVTLKNAAAVPAQPQYALVAAVRLKPEASEEAGYQHAVFGTLKSGHVSIDRWTAKDLTKEPRSIRISEGLPLLWVGSSIKYFAAILQPAQGMLPRLRSVYAAVVKETPEEVKQGDTSRAWIETEPASLAPGASVTDHYLFFLGPKDKKVFAQPEYLAYSSLIDYGWFGSVSQLLLIILDLFYSLVHNYGVAIILLTIVVRLALHPLTRKGQISMQRMQRLQPHLKELREKYKSDRQRQGREQMELFKKHGVNPMSGCLPLFLQIPIFIGLYRALQWAIELRQAPFTLWIRDLSQPDTITTLGTWPLNILPILMTISWFVQQQTMPKPVDPDQARQQKFMMYMPIIFGFMFYSTGSGLTLYWLTSTFLGILEQKLIKRQVAKMEAQGKLGPPVPEPGKA